MNIHTQAFLSMNEVKNSSLSMNDSKPQKLKTWFEYELKLVHSYSAATRASQVFGFAQNLVPSMNGLNQIHTRAKAREAQST